MKRITFSPSPTIQVVVPDTLQEVYDHIRGYFSRPDAVLAKDDTNACWYRDGGGRKCAVGCLVPDEVYEAEGVPIGTLDNVLWPEYASNFPLFVEVVNSDHDKVRFLSAAQKLHDQHATDPYNFVQLLDVLAEAAGLERPGL